MPTVTTNVPELDDDSRYHQRAWITQRIGWIAMLALVIAACLGVFGGGGPLRNSQTSSALLTIHYERFARYAALTTLEIAIADANERMTLGVNDAYLQAFEIQSITPEPSSMQITDAGIALRFDGEAAPARIVMRLKPRAIGSHVGVFRLGSTDAIAIRQFVYP